MTSIMTSIGHPFQILRRFLRRWRRLVAIASLALLILTLGSNLARATEPPVGTVDPVTPNLLAGHRLYLQNCATCHVGVPPATLPRRTWEALVLDTAHYGLDLPPIPPFEAQLIWNYLSIYSRPSPQGQRIAFRLSESPFFQAFHPQVNFSQPVTLRTCVTCHPSANAFNYQDWQE